MLLRRVIEHVKAQNWTAIALDFLIVVSGVFIGIQVANWNADRTLDKQRTAAIERLHDEAENIIVFFRKQLEDFERYNNARAEAIERLIANDWQGADPDLMDQAFGTTAIAPAAAPPRTAYDELVSTGLFAESGDTRLREVITAYYASLSQLQGQTQYVRTIITSNRRRIRPGIKLVLDRKAFRERRRIYDLDILGKDEDFIQEFIDGHSRQIALTGWWRETLEAAESMCTEIARVSGRPCETAQATIE